MTTRLSFIVASMLLLPACGDDGGEDTGGNGSSSGTAGSSGEPATTDEPPDSTTSGEGATGSSGTEPTTGPEPETSDTGASTGEAGSGDSTGVVPGDCAGQMDQTTCEEAAGCVWLGNMMSGLCVVDDPAICPDLMMMMACNQHPQCAWNNQDAVCGPA